MRFGFGGARLACVGLILLGIARPAEAQRQGTLGAVSQGRIGISLSIADSARVSTSGEVAITVLESGGAHRRAQPFCLWSTTGPRPYKVTAYGSGRSGIFTLGHPALPALPYSVRWRDAPLQALTPIAVEAKPWANVRHDRANGNCPDTIALAFHAAPRHFVVKGRYTGFLTIIAAPE